ncbi:MAG: hypothetical protein IJH12_08665 [Clostridia bacterium]|nr:hypothetical protein [Clostridia bacterium]
MKLVQLKCPNCGADVSIENISKIVTCQYCQTAFRIDGDNDSNNQEQNRIAIEQEYRQKSRENVNNMMAVFAVILSVLPMCCITQIISAIISIMILSSPESTKRNKNLAKISLLIIVAYIVIYTIIVALPTSTSENEQVVNNVNVIAE